MFVEGSRGWGGTAATEELAGRTEVDVTVVDREVTDGLGTKGWSGTAPLGNVDVIGAVSGGDGEWAFDLISVNRSSTLSAADAFASIPSQVFVFRSAVPSPPPPTVPSITLTSSSSF